MDKDKTRQDKDRPDDDVKINFSSLMGGDVLLLPFFKRQLGLIMLIVVLFILYISNRYSAQQEQVQIDKMKEHLVEARYSALAASSELMKESRQSSVQDALDEGHSEVKVSMQSPVMLEEDDE